MNFERYIARHISVSGPSFYSKPVAAISYISMALGLTLMLLSVSIAVGFKHSISDKIIGFTAPIKILPFDNNESMEEKPVTIDDELLSTLSSDPAISHIQYSAKKAGVIKTNDQMQGIVFKGVGSEYDKKFLLSQLVAGTFPEFGEERSNEVLISKLLADKLKVKVGDRLRTWFITGDNTAARGRNFTVAGLFDTSMQEFDNVFVIGDIRQVQKLNDWEENQVGSIELQLNGVEDKNDFAFSLYEKIPFNLRVVTAMDEYPQIFNWLDLLDMNVIVILVLLVVVASITMVSTLLILILERTSMVGILKALGATNRSIQNIFLYRSGSIILRGMLIGNMIGLGLLWLQGTFRFLSLSPEDYYVNYVPVEFNWLYFALLNLGTLVICGIMLIAPSFYVMRIVPAKAVRYE